MGFSLWAFVWLQINPWRRMFLEPKPRSTQCMVYIYLHEWLICMVNCREIYHALSVWESHGRFASDAFPGWWLQVHRPLVSFSGGGYPSSFSGGSKRGVQMGTQVKKKYLYIYYICINGRILVFFVVLYSKYTPKCIDFLNQNIWVSQTPKFTPPVDSDVFSLTDLNGKCQWRLAGSPMKSMITWHEPRKKPSYFPLYWLVNRDPYNGLLWSLYNCVCVGNVIPYITQPTRVFVHCSYEILVGSGSRILTSWLNDRIVSCKWVKWYVRSGRSTPIISI